MGTNNLRWNLAKYTLLAHESSEFSQNTGSGAPKKMLQSRSPGELYFQLSVSCRASRVFYKGNVEDEISLEGPGAPNLTRRDYDLVFNAMHPHFSQHKFRIKFAQSGGLSALDQCLDCISYLRHYVQITVAGSSTPTSSMSSLSERSDSRVSMVSLTTQRSRNAPDGNKSESSEQLSQELFSFSQDLGPQSLSQSTHIGESQNSLEDFSQPQTSSPFPQFLTKDSRTSSFSQSTIEEDGSNFCFDVPAGVRHSSPKRSRIEADTGYSNTYQSSDRMMTFEPPLRQEKRKSFHEPTKSLSQPPQLEDTRGTDRFRIVQQNRQAVSGSREPFKSLVQPAMAFGVERDDRVVPDQRKRLSDHWNTEQRRPTIVRSVSTETIQSEMTSEMMTQTENEDCFGAVKSFADVTDEELGDLVSVALSEPKFVAFAERVGQIMDKRTMNEWMVK